jgi:hypothetical protein
MLTLSLLGVFLAFCIMMGGVLAFCLRERRKVDGLEQSLDGTHEPANLQSGSDSNDDEAADNRVAMVLFGTIILGALLALMTGYLVFFRDWG